MKIAIIGAGFTGLAAAYYLSKKGCEVEVFERDSNPGGLAVGLKEKSWQWTLEKHYHHWFTNDKSVLSLASEINHKVLIRRPKTSSYVDNNIYQLDSPGSLLNFPKINIFDRIRMGASLAFLRYNPVWKPLEKFRAVPYLKATMGQGGYKKIWEPLMKNKLGKYSHEVSLAWFWARVYKRTSYLAYPEGGFLKFAEHLQRVTEKQGGKFYYNTEVKEITGGEHPEISFEKNNKSPKMNNKFDKVIVTLPSFLFLKLASDLPNDYKKTLTGLRGLGAINLILRLKSQFLRDGTYWLNMCDANSPILAIVEHTNFMDKKHYNNEHLLYLGNYLEPSDPRFKMSEKELLELSDPWLKKIKPDYRSQIIDYDLSRAPFAQPIIPVNYSKLIPSFTTPLKNVLLANIEQVYPWDRGTNYAVEIGKKITDMISK